MAQNGIPVWAANNRFRVRLLAPASRAQASRERGAEGSAINAWVTRSRHWSVGKGSTNEAVDCAAIWSRTTVMSRDCALPAS